MSSSPDKAYVVATPSPLFGDRFRFHAITVEAAVVAGVATYVTMAASLSIPAMFLGWTAYSVGGPRHRDGLTHFLTMVLGIAFAIGTAFAMALLGPVFGSANTPICVAGVMVLVLCFRTFVPFNSPVAYFLGLTSFFYSGLAPGWMSFAQLASAGAIGALSSAVVTYLAVAIERQGNRSRRPDTGQ